MITKGKIGIGEKIAEALRTNNIRFQRYTRNKMSVKGAVIAICGRPQKLAAEAAGSQHCSPLGMLSSETMGNIPGTERSVLEAESEKLMNQRMRAEQVKKEEENWAAKL